MLAFMRCCDRRGIKVKIVLVDWRKLLLDVEKRGDIFFLDTCKCRRPLEMLESFFDVSSLSQNLVRLER